MLKINQLAEDEWVLFSFLQELHSVHQRLVWSHRSAVHGLKVREREWKLKHGGRKRMNKWKTVWRCLVNGVQETLSFHQWTFMKFMIRVMPRVVSDSLTFYTNKWPLTLIINPASLAFSFILMKLLYGWETKLVMLLRTCCALVPAPPRTVNHWHWRLLTLTCYRKHHGSKS